MFNIFKKNTSEKNFWDWFESKKVRLEEFMDSDHRNYFIYNRLNTKIKEYHHKIFAELSKNEEDKYILILTADGNPEGFDPIQELYDSKPTFENWIIEKFRQPTDEFFVELGGIRFPFTDIEVGYELDSENETIHIKCFIPNFNSDPKKYESIAWLYLDHILGEFNVVKKLGNVLFEDLDQKDSSRINLIELRNIIDKELYKASN